MNQTKRTRIKTKNLFRRVIQKVFERPEELTVSQWSEKYRVLDDSSNFSGKWSNSITPYLIGIMDAFNESHIREIYFCKSSQIGGTEALINILSYLISEAPAPTMIVYPSDDLAKDISNDKLKPAFRLIPQIRKLFYENSSKELKLKFKTMVLYLRGAGSPSKLASKAIKYLFFDEIDKMGGASKKEASPFNLAMERIKTYKSQSKVYACSTPTLRTNYIWNLHDNADEVRHYFVPCPHCGEMIELVWKQVKFIEDEEKKLSPYDRAKTAVYICQECGCEVMDSDKPKMLREGKWIAIKKRGVGNPKSVGFWINSLYSIFITWADAAEEFLKSVGDPEMLQNFSNSWLAEPWEDTKLKTTEELVRERQTKCKELEVPDWALKLTGGVDVQESSVYWVIRAWGEQWTSQLIARGQEIGLAEVDKVMNLYYKKKNGERMVPALALVDSGDQTDIVYDFCAETADYTLPCKGSSNGMQTDYRLSKINKVTSKACGINLVLIDTGKYKDRIAARMRRETGTGSWMVFDGIDGEYAKQVTAEHKVNVRGNNGKSRQQWTPKTTHADNHYLDAEVYAMVAADMLGARNWHLENYKCDEVRPPEADHDTPEEKWIQQNESWL